MLGIVVDDDDDDDVSTSSFNHLARKETVGFECMINH
jgi:hypothetical protein